MDAGGRAGGFTHYLIIGILLLAITIMNFNYTSVAVDRAAVAFDQAADALKAL